MADFPFVDYLNRMLRAVSGALFASECFSCGRAGARLCDGCVPRLARPREQTCIGCSRPSPSGATCARCRGSWHAERLLAAADYGTAGHAVRAFKYGFDRSMARPLCALLSCVLRRAGPPRPLAGNPLFVPVPSSSRRMRWRGYNQAALLAHALANIALMPYGEVLERVRDAGPQARTAGRAERLDAMRGAFACMRPELVRERDVILVDDVCTTGATLDACALALKDAQARSVTGLVVARR